MRFVDTDVLLYAVSISEEESEKNRIARELLREPDLALSVQVLQEFYAQATRPSRSDPLTH
jgi:predicted nucleic acid-binding protein